MFQFISLPVFIISLAIGILFTYFKMPDKEIVYVYPTPENINTIQWKDKANNCYGWKQSEVVCPDNLERTQTIPIQN